MGAVAQPTFIATRLSTLQSETCYQYCILDQSTRSAIRFLCSVSIAHMVSMNVERYLATRHQYTYTVMVTIAQLPALVWIVASVATIPVVITDKRFYLTSNNILMAMCLGIIIFCHVTVYAETRRHEKQIATQQISARQNFLKEKKALKVTTCVVVVLLLCYLPIFAVRTLLVTSAITSKNIAFVCFYTATFVIMSNSFINPVIYCVRMRQFRVAFIEILLRKSYT